MIYTGLPVRAWAKKSGDDDEIIKSFGLDKELPIIFVTGGSHGAKSLNSYVAQHLEKILEFANVIMVTGENDYERIVDKVGDVKGKGVCRIYSFLTDNFNKGMFISDLIISRASATTLAEISSMAKPSILVPLPTSASNHQYFNAKSYEDMGACVLVEERDFDKINLAVLIKSLFEDEESYHEMTSSASAAMQTDGVGKIILDLINDLIEEKND